MIKKYAYNFDFFKWIKKTELVQLAEINPEDDPVRPELDNEFRVSNGRKIFGLKYNNEIEGVVCIAFTNELPATVKELDLMSVNEKDSQIAIAYTLWSLKKGAGKKIMKELLKYMKEQNNIDSIMTLSPLTPIATHYHIRNGAKLIKINPTTQNFEYKI
ncbi:GNAT family N-acetyltransferase [Alphaproteobacteria bacterium]|nr:GNAT family N-acetyltransferase [Alphaproteobacteria bacterium]